MTEEGKELLQTPIECEGHAVHLRRVGANLMAKNIVGGKADNEQISCRPLAQLLVYDKLLDELQLVIVGEWSGPDDLIETCRRAIFALAGGGWAEDRSVPVFPFAVQEFLRTVVVVEIAHPFRKIGRTIGTIVGGGNPVATFGIDPVSAVSRKPGGQYGCAIFQRDSEYAGFAAGG